MGKIFFTLAMAGLCFGQWIKSEIDYCHPEPVSGSKLFSQSMYLKPLNEWDYLTMQSLRAQQFNSIPFSPLLMMQAEGETLQSKSSFWKQAGIYGLEFVGGSVGSCASLCFSWLPWPPWKVPSGGEYVVPMMIGCGIYIVSNPLLTTGFTVITAKTLNQKGSWKKALIGSSLGTIAGFFAKIHGEHGARTDAEAYFMLFTAITLPPIGAVVGYNW